MTLVAYCNRKLWADSLSMNIDPETGEPDHESLSYRRKIFTDPDIRIAIASSGGLFGKKDRDTISLRVLDLIIRMESDDESQIEIPSNLRVLPAETIVISAKHGYRIHKEEKRLLVRIDDDDPPLFYGSGKIMATMIYARTDCILKTIETVLKYDPAVGGTIYCGGCENLNPIVINRKG